MCFYSYDMYARCGHCEVCLVRFCEKATPIGKDDETSGGKDNDNPSGKEKEGAPSHGNGNPDPQHPAHDGSQASGTQHQPSLSLDITNTTSSAQAHTSPLNEASLSEHPYEQPSGQMDVVRQWMSGGTPATADPQGQTEATKTEPEALNKSASSGATVRPSAHQQSSTRGHRAEHYDPSGGPSDISNLDGPFERARDAGDTNKMIEMINKMKRDNAAKLARTNAGRTQPKTVEEQRMDTYLNTPLATMTELNQMQGHEAQAAIQEQQRLFEDAAGEATSEAPKKRKKKSGNKKKKKKPAATDDRRNSMIEGADDEDTELSIDTNAADESMVTDEDTLVASPVRKPMGPRAYETSSSATVPQIPMGKRRADDDEKTPTQATFDAPIGKGRGRATEDAMLPRTLPVTTAMPKATPSFAQPTQAYTIRAGETVRQEPTSSPASPKKTARGSQATIETGKPAQSPQKRKSLPGTWLKAAEDQIEKAKQSTASGEQGSSPVDPAAGTPDNESVKPKFKGKGTKGKTLGAGGPHAHLIAEKIKTQFDANDQSMPSGPLRKRPSGYMSPTAAATQRNITTLGQEVAKYSSPKVKKGTLKLNTSLATQQSTPSPLSADSGTTSAFPAYTEPKSAVTASPPKRHSLQGMSFGSSAPASPTKIPRPAQGGRAKAQSAATPTSAKGHKRNESTLAELPDIANTTTKRRTSQSHLLEPIMRKLDSLSLLVHKDGRRYSVDAGSSEASAAVETGQAMGQAPPSDRHQEAIGSAATTEQGHAQAAQTPPSARRNRSGKKQSAKQSAAPDSPTETRRGMDGEGLNDAARDGMEGNITDSSTDESSGGRGNRGSENRKSRKPEKYGKFDRAVSNASTGKDKKENFPPTKGASRQSSMATQPSLQAPTMGLNEATNAQSRASSVFGTPQDARRQQSVYEDPAVIAASRVVATPPMMAGTPASSRGSSLRATAKDFTPMWSKQKLDTEIEDLHNSGSSFHHIPGNNSATWKAWRKMNGVSTDAIAAHRSITLYRRDSVPDWGRKGAMGIVSHWIERQLKPRLLEVARQIKLANGMKEQSAKQDGHEQSYGYGNHQYSGYDQSSGYGHAAAQSATQELAQAVGFSPPSHDSYSNSAVSQGHTRSEADSIQSPYQIGATVDHLSADPGTDEYSPNPDDDFMTRYNKIRARPIPAQYSSTDPTAPTYVEDNPQPDDPNLYYPSTWQQSPETSSGSEDSNATLTQVPSTTRSGPAALPTQTNPWALTSSHPTRRFGWSGGDGREISFAGHGPFAEANPNSTVQLINARRVHVFSDSSPSPPASAPTGPRKMIGGADFQRLRANAIKKQYPMVPCGDSTITRAFEHVPFGTKPGLAYCNECTEKDPGLLDLVDYSGVRPPRVEYGSYTY